MSPLRSTAVWVTLVAGLLTVALFLPDHTLVDGYDWTRMNLFAKEHYRDALLSGRLPQWNPYVALGRPFAADVEMAVFYPPNLLYLLGTGPGLLLNLCLHLALALAGSRRLARSLGCREAAAWLAAIGFAAGAPLIGRLQSGQVQVFCALCWLPAVCLAARNLLEQPDRKRTAFLALAFALLFLAGSPPMFWIAAWFCLLWLALELLAKPARERWRMIVPRLALAGLAAGALAAVQLLPFLELVREGNRQTGGVAYAVDPLQSQAAASWMSLFRSQPAESVHFYWEFNLHAGALLAALAAVSLVRFREPAVRNLALLAALFGVLATGPATPLLPALVDHVPGWDAFRFHARYAIATSFALCLLAALGAEHLLRRLERRPVLRPLVLLAGWLLLGLNTADLLRVGFARSGLYSRPESTLQEADVVGALRAAGLPVAGQPPPRVLVSSLIARENLGMQHGYSSVSGFGNPWLREVWTMLHARAELPPKPGDPVNLPQALYARPPAAFRETVLSAWWDAGQERLVVNHEPGPRAWLEPGGAGNEAAVIRFSEQEVVMSVRSHGPQRLLLAEPWYPGWRAFIDGRETSVQPAHRWMRAIDLPANPPGVDGPQEVRLTFQSRLLPAGAGISLVALAALVAALVRRRRS